MKASLGMVLLRLWLQGCGVPAGVTAPRFAPWPLNQLAGHCTVAHVEVVAVTPDRPVVRGDALVVGGINADINREAKAFIKACKAGGLALPAILAAIRQCERGSLRKAVLLRLADTVSDNNPLRLAFRTEAGCCQ